MENHPAPASTAFQCSPHEGLASQAGFANLRFLGQNQAAYHWPTAMEWRDPPSIMSVVFFNRLVTNEETPGCQAEGFSGIVCGYSPIPACPMLADRCSYLRLSPA